MAVYNLDVNEEIDTFTLHGKEYKIWECPMILVDVFFKEYWSLAKFKSQKSVNGYYYLAKIMERHNEGKKLEELMEELKLMLPNDQAKKLLIKKIENAIKQ